MPLAGFLATTVGKVVAVILGIAGLGILSVGGLYVSDYGFEATVVDKSCTPAGESTVTVEPKVYATEYMQPLPFDQCSIIQEGNFVVYNVRSERVRVWDVEGGTLLWDSEKGLSGGGGSGGGPGGLI